MFHSCSSNIEINCERCICFIFYDKSSSYGILLEKDDSVSLHHKNIQVLRCFRLWMTCH